MFSENGIIAKAREAAEKTNQAVINEQAQMNELAGYMENMLNGIGGSGTTPEEPVDITTITDTNHDTIEGKDIYGNIVTIPKGFKVVISEGTTVPEGIVIEDINGNQFVWIPVGTVYKDGTGTNTSTIKLGRYTFDESTGATTMQQSAFAGDNSNNDSQTYVDEVHIMGYDYSHIEVDESRTGTVDESNHKNDLNATAKNLAGFVGSVKDNGGYYIARYEASYGSGSSSEDWKPLSQVSTASSIDSMNYQAGTLWNCYVTQLDASKICQNMYRNDETVGVESDLTNSYAWDTAIVFIQEMLNNNYANKIDGNGTLKNTGETGDKACNIYDMAGNLVEWTTEYSTYTVSSDAYPGTARGGVCDDGSDACTAGRNSLYATFSNNLFGFRLTLYVK